MTTKWNLDNSGDSAPKISKSSNGEHHHEYNWRNICDYCCLWSRQAWWSTINAFCTCAKDILSTFPLQAEEKQTAIQQIGILFSKFTGLPVTRNWGLISHLQHKTCDPFVCGALASWYLRAFASSVPLLSYHWIPANTISNKDCYDHMKSTLWTSCVTSSGFLHSNLRKQYSIGQFSALQIDENRV